MPEFKEVTIGQCRLIHGDNLEVLPTLEEDSVDTIITDPPYGLSFMGRNWDHGIPGVEFWKQALRVAKPGATMLAFGGTRTFHRLACAIEDAGWELRDTIMWVYGSGFPKSLDIGKAMDRIGGISVELQSRMLRQKRESASLSRAEVASLVGCTESSIRDWEEGRARESGAAKEWLVPSPEYRNKLADVLGYSSDERAIVGCSDDRRNDGTIVSLGHSGTLRTGGSTITSRQWEGWGTALKPAWEPVIVAMKPLDGTFANNAIKHGVAGFNIDAARIESTDNLNGGAYTSGGGRSPLAGDDRDGAAAGMFQPGKTCEREFSQPSGRFPANLIHDGSDEVASLFPQSAGQLGDISHSAPSQKTSNVYGAMKREGEPSQDRQYTENGGTNFAAKPGARRLDSGSAARFFYAAKASKSDRGGAFNTHPTVKPQSLMEYLCRLTSTPTGGTVLDMFMGSGSTGVACVATGRKFIGIELNDTPAEPFFTIAGRRMSNAVNGTIEPPSASPATEATATEPAPKKPAQRSLFDEDE